MTTQRKVHILRPNNTDVKLWRYMEFIKFVDLLQRRALWFARLDQLRDKHEGLLVKSVRETLSVLAMETEAYGGFTHEQWRKRGCVNCWHMSDYESAAMWDLYSAHVGVAICSHVNRLESAFPRDYSLGSWGLYGNSVRYVDFDANTEPLVNVATGRPSVRAVELHGKRRSFEHEREYRLTSTLEGTDEDRHGKYIPVQLEKLIEEVWITPTAPSWVVDVVTNEGKKYGVTAPIQQSKLDGPALK
jgi:hypothetical protein